MRAHRFRAGQDVAVVAYDRATGEPLEAVEPVTACVFDATAAYVAVRLGDGPARVFEVADGTGQAWRDSGRQRLVPVCLRCEAPILGEPVCSAAGPGYGEWCGGDCYEAAAEAYYDQRVRDAF